MAKWSRAVPPSAAWRLLPDSADLTDKGLTVAVPLHRSRTPRPALALCAVTAICGALAGVTPPAGAQSLQLYGGVGKQERVAERAAPWAVEYVERARGPFEIGLIYLNQGHYEGHHRDGIGAELWLKSPAFGPNITLAAGAGPFYYFDTKREGDDGYANQHGTGIIYSVEANWQFHRRWFLSLRGNHVHTRSSFDTNAVMLGVGYRWQSALADARPEGNLPLARNEIDVLLGQTVVNSLTSNQSMAAAIEYRRSLRHWLDWSATLLHEGDTRVIRRDGIASQLWLVRRAHDDRVALSVGLGPYLAIDDHEVPGDRERLSALISLSASYRFTPGWNARITWHRVLANYNRDTDIFFAGLGYGF